MRTAFSPGQLLKLEHAFENNQYVVGAERKQLAQALNLSETQVIIAIQITFRHCNYYVCVCAGDLGFELIRGKHIHTLNNPFKVIYYQ